MTRSDVAELLRAGYGDRTIARRLAVTTSSVTAARTELGLPEAQGGTKRANSVEDLYWNRTQPAEGGHLTWDGHRNAKGTPLIHWGGQHHSALRVAYRIRTGTDPQGYAFVNCQHPGCVAPAHIGDSAHDRRPAHHRKAAGRKPNASREQIITLLREGLSDKEIGRRLHTNPKRAAALRTELGLASHASRALTFADRWASSTEPEGGHVRWTGRHRDGRTPAVFHEGRDASVRRIVFEQHHGRPPVGEVQPGCDATWCVRAEHLEDAPMRAKLGSQLAAIFGEAA
jgi:DNA-binding CsgD family transcriptional regulator